MIRDLISDMTFVENVMMDTFIDDGEVWKGLRALSDEIRSERKRHLSSQDPDNSSKTVLRFHDQFIFAPTGRRTA